MKTNRGFTIPELLVSLLIIGIISILVTQLLIFNANNSAAYSAYNQQQFTAHQAYIRLSKEIEEASLIRFDEEVPTEGRYKVIELTIDGETRKWKLDGGVLSLFNGTEYAAVISDLDPSSRFIDSWSFKCLTVVLMPETADTAKNDINLSKPIVAQFSYNYKQSLP